MILAAVLSLSAFTAAFAEAYPDVYVQKAGPGAQGWIQTNDGWMYLDKGLSLKNWALVGDYWYWLGDNGLMITGWKNINGTDYYFTEAQGTGFPVGSCQNPDAAGTAVVNNAGLPAVTGNPYGHDCVEVNLTNQCVIAWKGDTAIIVGPCVTGYKGVHDTAAGDFRVQSKETDRYLQGYNDNGTRYKSYVNFWMPFNGGQGLHDAGWRGTSHENFGGTIYAWNGSHGCVNLPYDVAEAIFNFVHVGTPVHTHY